LAGGLQAPRRPALGDTGIRTLPEHRARRAHAERQPADPRPLDQSGYTELGYAAVRDAPSKRE
jgi:hypothetical protein